MEKGRQLPLALVLVVSGVLASLNWMCSVEDSGFQTASPIPVREIIAQLASASTQEEAESAIERLFDKIRLRRPGAESEYADYVLPHNVVPVLAKAHLLSLTDKNYQLTFDELFEIEKRFPGGDWIAPVRLEAVLETFERQTLAALKNPDAPQAALVVAIASENGGLPSSFAEFDPGRSLSAVQDFLFSVWLNREFQANDGVIQDTKAVQYNVATVECPLRSNEKKAVKIRYLNGLQANCMVEAKKTYKMAVKACFRDPEGCDDGDWCLDSALLELQEIVDLCTQFEDQVRGDKHATTYTGMDISCWYRVNEVEE